MRFNQEYDLEDKVSKLVFATSRLISDIKRNN